MGTSQLADAAITLLRGRLYATVGNPDIRKVRLLAAPGGRQLAVVMQNQRLTFATETVGDVSASSGAEHRRRYSPDCTRNSNLNFVGSKLAIGHAMDWWMADSLEDFRAFLDWYESPHERPRTSPLATDALRAHAEPTPRVDASLVDAPLFERYREVLVSIDAPRVRDQRLLIGAADAVRIYYAPFEHLNADARVVLVGITPGPTQMVNANNAARKVLLAGGGTAEAMRNAKETAAFSGEPMRSNLIRQLNHWGFPQWLGIDDAAELFGVARHLVQATSLLRYPVFVSDDDYRGNPDMLRHPLLRRHLLEHFASELAALPQAVFVGLGPAVQRVLQWLVAEGHLAADRVAAGLLHPSGFNTYRIAYLTGDRGSTIPHATDPEPYDRGRLRFRAQHLP